MLWWYGLIWAIFSDYWYSAEGDEETSHDTKIELIVR